MAHHPVHIDTNQRYELTSKWQSRLIMFLVVGLVMVAIGCFMAANDIGGGHHDAPHNAAQGHEDIGEFGDPHGIKSHSSEHVSQGAEGHAANVSGEAHGPKGKVASGGHGGQPTGHGYSWWQRFWATLWMHSVFFTGISVIGVFFTAVNYVAMAGWSAGLKRVFMSLSAFLPIGLALLLITFLIGGHDIFHWTHEGLYEKGGPEYDEILSGKRGYLNTPFFLARMVVFVGAWILFAWLIRKNSLREDQEGGSALYKKNQKLSAAFLVVFGVSSSMLAWDWLMSIDSHWYSTLFGWYTFASWFVSGLAVIALITVFLKDQGLMTHINDSHLHDLGKFIFAFSIFWTYLWTAQFLLIWYANIPEEAIYYHNRLYGLEGKYQGPFFINFFLNFVFPFLFLMPREAKRTNIFLKIVAFAVLTGHWMDHYQMVMPGTVGVHGGFGFIEFGMLVTFVSAFILVVSKALASVPLVAKNHPMLEESLHHDI